MNPTRVDTLLLVLLLSGCGILNLRPVECDPGERIPEPRLDCHQSVILAGTALRQPHAAITRTQFVYGSRTHQIGGFGGFNGGEIAYVVFTFADGTHQSVQLYLTRDGPLLEGSFRSG